MASKWDSFKESSTAAILDAAVLEFAEKGYAGATTRGIAARAGVSNGLITKYFKTKEELLCILLREVKLSRIFDGVGKSGPYETFCVYLDYIRNLQKEKPYRFRFHLFLMNDRGIPAPIYGLARKNFDDSRMEEAILEAQACGELIGGDAYQIFRLFYRLLYSLLDQYAVIGAEAPDNDTILSVLGYRRKNG